MRVGAVLLLVACGTSHQSPTRPDHRRPTADEANGSPCDGDLQCTYAESTTRNLYCTCQVGRLWCSDCDATSYGFGACTAGCTCTVRGNWNSTSQDAASACPRDPG